MTDVLRRLGRAGLSGAGPSSNLIVTVTLFGLNALCRGTDFAYRLDRQEVIDWINSK